MDTRLPINFHRFLFKRFGDIEQNILLSAHCAGNSQEALDTTSTVVVEETIRMLNGQVPLNLVNRLQLTNYGYLR